MKLIIAGIISPNRATVDAFVERHASSDPLVGVLRDHDTSPDASWVGATLYERGEALRIALRNADNATRAGRIN